MFWKRSIFIVSIILICVSAVWAGDTAVFVDLGFSPDGKTYMFGQYGVISPSLHPWTELYIVDVVRNNFVQNGRISHTEAAPIKAGQDGSGIFYRILANNSGITSRYSLNFQNQGQPLYISRDTAPPERGEKIDFRDFIWGKAYKAELVPSISGSGQNTRSSFHINLEVRSLSGQGQVKTYTVGNPGIVRQKIASYNIKKVLIDANGGSIIFVIEMKRAAENGYDIRYMVEALKL